MDLLEGLKAVMGGETSILHYREGEHLHKIFLTQPSTHVFEFMTAVGAHGARAIHPVRIHTM